MGSVVFVLRSAGVVIGCGCEASSCGNWHQEVRYMVGGLEVLTQPRLELISNMKIFPGKEAQPGT